MPLRRMRSTWWPFSTSMVLPSRLETTSPVSEAPALTQGQDSDRPRRTVSIQRADERPQRPAALVTTQTVLGKVVREF
jgi:hypothetical protein